jgi:hypothetical protein
MVQVWNFGLLKLFNYCMYLLLLNVYAERWLMIGWAIYFTTIELIQVYGLGIMGFLDFWNMMDYLRIFLILMFIVTEYNENEEKALITYVLLTILSWLGLMEQLRIFNMFQFILTLVIRSLSDMVSFLVVLVIMYCAFSLGYYYMINGHTRYSEGWEENLKESFLLQFVMIFGSFGGYEMETNLQMVLFMVTSVMMPLLMMNILIAILGQTYVEVKLEWA